ncbi:MAG: response regulator transcription factor [Mycobacteriales bacterium]
MSLTQSDADRVLVLDGSPFAAEVLARGLRACRLDAVAGSWAVGVPPHPAVVLLDADGPIEESLAALGRHRGPSTRTVLMAHGHPPTDLPGASGVSTAVSRSQTVQQVAEVLRLVARGVAAPDFVPQRPPANRYQLTGRERQVLGQLTLGVKNDDIARALQISPHTARTHVQNVLAKLGAESRLEAAAVARREGLLGTGASVHR